MIQPPRIYALIVAAGTGTRAGGAVPKQYQPIGGVPMLRHSVERFAHHGAITGVQLVIHPEHHDLYATATEGLTLLPPVFGGRERTDSVRAGLNALAAFNPDYVLIHDAARPFLSREVLDRLVTALGPDHAVAPVLPVPDTVRRHTGEGWEEVPREGLMRIQTPQCFPFAAIKAIFDHGAAAATDDIALWLAAGRPLVHSAGAEELRKVTTPEDILFAEQHARETRKARRMAVGMGFDVHELMPSGERGVIRLGGVDIRHDYKLHGHSDADVVLHAIADAIYGALADGDIGYHFPPSDARLKGADSAMFIAHARSRMQAHEAILQHLDVTIICEQPKVSPHRDAMREAIAALLHVPPARVAVKATTTEKLGFTGRGEGIAAQAIATLSLPEEL